MNLAPAPATNDAWYRVADEVAEASRLVINLLLSELPPDEAWPLLVEYQHHLTELQR